jgi:hypothetical protein
MSSSLRPDQAAAGSKIVTLSASAGSGTSGMAQLRGN